MTVYYSLQQQSYFLKVQSLHSLEPNVPNSGLYQTSCNFSFQFNIRSFDCAFNTPEQTVTAMLSLLA